ISAAKHDASGSVLKTGGWLGSPSRDAYSPAAALTTPSCASTLQRRVVTRETWSRAVDQRLVFACNHLRTKTEAVHDAWTEVLDDHVRSTHQTLRNTSIGRTLGVQHDAACAALQYGIGWVLPARVAGRIDAHDVRAVVGEHLSNQWPSGHVLT